MTISLKSYAKINIGLNVVGKRPNGYHELDSVVLPIELHDTILCNKIKNGVETYVTVDDFSQGSIHYNIASFAIERLAAEYKFDTKFTIFIHKVIPMQAGLGGGSSNAVTAMKIVAKYLKLNVPEEDYLRIGESLGADCPFFVKCRPSRMRGIGEQLEPITVKENYFVLLVKPHEGLATKSVFDKLDAMEIKTGNMDDVVKALETGDEDLLASSIVNSLEEPACELLPEIKKIKGILQDFGLKVVGMSGSGSTVYALSTDKKLINKIALQLEDTYTVKLTKVIK